MAMNKAEKQMVEDLKTQAALSWTGYVATDVDAPEKSNELVTGFLYIGASSDYPRVDVACSSSVHHAIGRTDQTTSQNGRELYSTRLLALRALRHEVEKQCAKRLRSVDRQIEEVLLGKTP